MSWYRTILQCNECGKIYRGYFWPNIHSGTLITEVCGKCGAKDSLIRREAKPKMFGLKGWVVKGKRKEWWEVKND